MSRRNRNNFESHDFYCINCGTKSISLMRPVSIQRGKFHRKLLFCFHCKHTVNHIECRNDEERKKFYQDFQDGKYIEEAAEELEFEKQQKSLIYKLDHKEK